MHAGLFEKNSAATDPLLGYKPGTCPLRDLGMGPRKGLQWKTHILRTVLFSPNPRSHHFPMSRPKLLTSCASPFSTLEGDLSPYRGLTPE